MQTSTKKEYRDARRRSGEAVWSCRQGTATRGPCRRPARTFLVTSLVLHHFSPIRFGGATASTAQRVDTNFDICMESSALHAYIERLVTTIRGPVGTLFSRESSGEPRFAPGPLTLAHLLLFHRRLDGDMATTRALVAVKIRCQSEQTRERKRSRRPGSIVNGLHSDCDRWPCWSMMPLFPRATSLSD